MTRHVYPSIYWILWIIVISTFISANKISVKRYTPYQIIAWEIKANEGYRSWWYPDGKTRTGRQKYSIGFGWNDLGNVRRKEIAKYTRDGIVTYSEAWEITMKEIAKYGILNNDPYRHAALVLYSYNCGVTKSGNALGKCCKSGKWCGSPYPNIRKAHNRRRKLELALWNHDWRMIQLYTEENRKKVIQLNKR